MADLLSSVSPSFREIEVEAAVGLEVHSGMVCHLMREIWGVARGVHESERELCSCRIIATESFGKPLIPLTGGAALEAIGSAGHAQVVAEFANRFFRKLSMKSVGAVLDERGM